MHRARSARTLRTPATLTVRSDPARGDPSASGAYIDAGHYDLTTDLGATGLTVLACRLLTAAGVVPVPGRCSPRSRLAAVLRSESVFDDLADPVGQHEPHSTPDLPASPPGDAGGTREFRR